MKLRGKYVQNKATKQVGHIVGVTRITYSEPPTYHVQWAINEPSTVHKRTEFTIFSDQEIGREHWLMWNPLRDDSEIQERDGIENE